MKICIINPPVAFKKSPLEEWSNNSIYNFPYLGIRYLEAALIESGIDVDILDCPCEDISLKSLCKIICENEYTHIGISMFYYNLFNCERLLVKLAVLMPSAFIFAGGYAATLNYSGILKSSNYIDTVIIGDGETILVNLFKALQKDEDWRAVPGIAYLQNGEVHFNPPDPIEDLDLLPFPKHTLCRYSKTLTLITSRGCYGNCSFCSEKKFYSYNKYRQVIRTRSVENVVEEIEENYKTLSPLFISMCDSDFMPGTLNRRAWIYSLLEELDARKIRVSIRVNTRANDIIYYKDDISWFKSMGLDSYFLGIETFNERQLELYDKKTSVQENIEAIKILQSHNVSFEMGFIIIEPYVSIEDIIENLKILKGLNVYNCLDYNQSFFTCGSTLFSIYGTKIFSRVHEDGIQSSNDRGYIFVNPEIHQFYEDLKLWMNTISNFDYLRYLIDKAIYYSEQIMKQKLLDCLNKLREIDVDFMLELAYIYQNQLNNVEVELLLAKYNTLAEQIFKEYCSEVDYIMQL